MYVPQPILSKAKKLIEFMVVVVPWRHAPLNSFYLHTFSDLRVAMGPGGACFNSQLKVGTGYIVHITCEIFQVIIQIPYVVLCYA